MKKLGKLDGYQFVHQMKTSMLRIAAAVLSLAVLGIWMIKHSPAELAEYLW